MDAESKGLGRFAEASIFIMISLGDGPKHGYAMMDDIKRSYGVRLGPGTLYTAISRLEQQGLIEAMEAEDRRRPYRLTDAGLAALRTQLSSLGHLAASGLKRLAPS